MEHLGKFLKRMEKYTKVVDAARSSNPRVSGLVWAGILAIMRVRINVLSLDIDFPLAVDSPKLSLFTR